MHDWFRHAPTAIDRSQTTTWFLQLLDWIADASTASITWLQQMFTEGKFPRPVPQIGWLGVLAIAIWVTYAVAGGRMVPLVAVSILLFGALGFWQTRSTP